jgi:hypothetical protein
MILGMKDSKSLLFPDLSQHYSMNTYGGSEAMAPLFNLGIRWKWVVIFKPHLHYPRGTAPCTQWIGGYVGRRAGLDTAVAKRKNPIIAPAWNWTPVV